MAREIGVQRKTIIEATRLGEYPAAWFVALRDMARRRKMPPPPESLFSFKRAS